MTQHLPLNARTDAILRRLVRKEAGPAVRKVLAKSRPPDIAAAMSHLTHAEQRRLYGMIEDRDVQAEVLSCLGEDAVRELTRELSAEVVVDLLERMAPDDATDVIGALPDELRSQVIGELTGDATDDLDNLLAWPEDSAGGLMSPLAFEMPDTATCGEAIASLQERGEELEQVFYLYVVDKNRRLVGVVSLRTLLVHPPSTPLVSVMSRDVIAVGPRTDQEEVARVVARYDLLAVPVVDEESRILGIVTVDDVVDVIREEAVEDMMLMAGMGDDFDVAALGDRSSFRLARGRAGWLLATACGGIVASQIVGIYEAALPIATLAGFIPVVMGMGGNVGIQSVTVTVRGLATGHVQLGGALAFILRELRIGFLLGVLYGGLVGLYAVVAGAPDPLVGLSVGLSVFLAIGIGTMMGATLPVLLSRLGVDPAVATGPFVTTSVDIVGIFVYFNVARVMLGLGG